MRKRDRQLEILNIRRKAIKENLENFESEKSRLHQKMLNLQDLELGAEFELQLIENKLNELITIEHVKVNLHLVHDEFDRNPPKKMLEIIIKGHPPVFKIIHDIDTFFYSEENTPKDKFALEGRLREIAFEWIKSQESLLDLITDINEKYSNVTEEYINDSSIDRKIERDSVFIHSHL